VSEHTHSNERRRLSDLKALISMIVAHAPPPSSSAPPIRRGPPRKSMQMKRMETRRVEGSITVVRKRLDDFMADEGMVEAARVQGDALGSSTFYVAHSQLRCLRPADFDDDAPTMRRLCSDNILACAKKQDMDPDVNVALGYDNWVQYAQCMRRRKEDGDEMYLQAIANVYTVKMCVIMSSAIGDALPTESFYFPNNTEGTAVGQRGTIPICVIGDYHCYNYITKRN